MLFRGNRLFPSGEVALPECLYFGKYVLNRSTKQLLANGKWVPIDIQDNPIDASVDGNVISVKYAKDQFLDVFEIKSGIATKIVIDHKIIRAVESFPRCAFLVTLDTTSKEDSTIIGYIWEQVIEFKTGQITNISGPTVLLKPVNVIIDHYGIGLVHCIDSENNYHGSGCSKVIRHKEYIFVSDSYVFVYNINTGEFFLSGSEWCESRSELFEKLRRQKVRCAYIRMNVCLVEFDDDTRYIIRTNETYDLEDPDISVFPIHSNPKSAKSRY